MNEARPTLTLSQRKRMDILDAARAEFLDRGFRDTSMDRVAERAQVSKRTVYNHFAAKDDLFRAIAQQVIEALREAVTVEYDAGRPLDEQLRDIARREVRQITDPDYVAMFRVFLAEARHFPGLFDELTADGGGHGPVQAWIDAAVADGALTVSDSALASQQFVSLLKGALFWPRVAAYGAAPDDAARRAVIDGAVALFLDHYRR